MLALLMDVLEIETGMTIAIEIRAKEKISGTVIEMFISYRLRIGIRAIVSYTH
jgi:hypothetical protein